MIINAGIPGLLSSFFGAVLGRWPFSCQGAGFAGSVPVQVSGWIPVK